MTLNYKLFLKSCEVKRWGIVNWPISQSVGEHLIRTWAITTCIRDAMFPTPHNSFESYDMEFLALTHDGHEVLTGDIPSTFKDAARSVVEKLEEGARIQMGLPLLRSSRNTVAGYVVKIADKAEALLFMHENGGRNHRPDIYDYGVEKLRGAIDAAVQAWPAYDWASGRRSLVGVSDRPGWAEALGEAS